MTSTTSSSDPTRAHSSGGPHARTLRELPALLSAFGRNPIEAMRSHVTMTAPTAIVLQVSVSALSGAAFGAVSGNWVDLLIGAIVFPLTNFITTWATTLFLAYFFSWSRATFLDFRRLYSVVVLSILPYFVVHPLAGFLPPLDLIGFALSLALLVVGLVDQFSLEKKIVLRLAGVLGGVFFVIWAITLIGSGSASLDPQPAPRPLDHLETEMKGRTN